MLLQSRERDCVNYGMVSGDEAVVDVMDVQYVQYVQYGMVNQDRTAGRGCAFLFCSSQCWRLTRMRIKCRLVWW